MRWEIADPKLEVDFAITENGKVVEKVDQSQGAYSVVVESKKVSKGKAAWSVKSIGGNYFGVGLSPDSLTYFDGEHASAVATTRIYLNAGYVVSSKRTLFFSLFFKTQMSLFLAFFFRNLLCGNKKVLRK